MPSAHDLLERQMADVELSPFTLGDFHARRHRKQRNRRIATTVMGAVLSAAVVGGVLQTLSDDGEIVASQNPSETPGATASPFLGTWVIGRAGSYFPGAYLPDSMEIRLVGDEGLHEVVIRKAQTPECGGGPSTMRGTGRPEAPRRLVVVGDITCDDGSEPVTQTEDQGVTDLELVFDHDPVTDELVGGLGSLFIREGAVLAQGDPMRSIDRMIDAVNRADADAFVAVFAPDGRFLWPGRFDESRARPSVTQFALPVSDPEHPELVRAWMAVNEPWAFEAEVVSCAADADPFGTAAGTDAWVECEMVARWPRLSLELTDRWRFELRGERLVGWYALSSTQGRPDRVLPLGYDELQAWEAWLEANHPDDAARWLNEDWTIDGVVPGEVIPYDPTYADEIEASIDDYLDE